jgi:hypothetical protein
LFRFEVGSSGQQRRNNHPTFTHDTSSSSSSSSSSSYTHTWTVRPDEPELLPDSCSAHPNIPVQYHSEGLPQPFSQQKKGSKMVAETQR